MASSTNKPMKNETVERREPIGRSSSVDSAICDGAEDSPDEIDEIDEESVDETLDENDAPEVQVK
jgi:hypothetical protein